jgi:hypothetical protein
MRYRIEVKFNHSRQSVVFHIHSEGLQQFRRRHKCDAWFWERSGKKPRNGVFGYIHLPRIEPEDTYFIELVAHEVQHLIIGWVLAWGNDLQYLANAEEQVASMTGDIIRKFWRAYRRNTPVT